MRKLYQWVVADVMETPELKSVGALDNCSAVVVFSMEPFAAVGAFLPDTADCDLPSLCVVTATGRGPAVGARSQHAEPSSKSQKNDHPQHFTALCAVPGGIVVAGSANGDVAVYEVQCGHEASHGHCCAGVGDPSFSLRALSPLCPIHRRAIVTIAVCAATGLVATGSFDGSIALFPLLPLTAAPTAASLPIHRMLCGHLLPITGLAFAPAHGVLLSVAGDATCRVWPTASSSSDAGDAVAVIAVPGVEALSCVVAVEWADLAVVAAVGHLAATSAFYVIDLLAAVRPRGTDTVAPFSLAAVPLPTTGLSPAASWWVEAMHVGDDGSSVFAVGCDGALWQWRVGGLQRKPLDGQLVACDEVRDFQPCRRGSASVPAALGSFRCTFLAEGGRSLLGGHLDAAVEEASGSEAAGGATEEELEALAELEKENATLKAVCTDLFGRLKDTNQQR